MTKSPPMVLVVDDNEHVVRLISMLLRDAGYRCVTALTGAQGLFRFREERPAVVITDLNMPVGDGAILLAELHRISRVPVIILSGYAADYTDRLRYLGDVLVLTKPFEPQILLKHVRARCSPTWQARAQTPPDRAPMPGPA
ncbi:MAG: putative OmpR family two-component response regulator [Gemmatimonadetes bacterium]|nr:putative OmpR family two-component response regulator [Gemmatimonadota bacterium]